MRRIRMLPVLVTTCALFLSGCGKSTPGVLPVSNEIKTFISDSVTTSDIPATGPETAAIENLASSVLKLEIYNDKGSKIATGTGFVYGDPALLVTSAHVIVNMDYMEVTKDDGGTFRISEGAALLDKDKDIAMFRLPEDVTIPAIEPADAVPARGTPVFTIGSQAGLTNLVTTGIVSGTWIDEGVNYLIFTAPVSGGNSGGPIFDNSGKLVGVVIGTYEKGQNLNIGLYAGELPATK